MPASELTLQMVCGIYVAAISAAWMPISVKNLNVMSIYVIMMCVGNDDSSLEAIIWYTYVCIRKGYFCQQLQANWTVLVQVVDLLGITGNVCTYLRYVLVLQL